MGAQALGDRRPGLELGQWVPVEPPVPHRREHRGVRRLRRMAAVAAKVSLAAALVLELVPPA